MNIDYQAYLLRLQRNQSTNQWRATMINAHTGDTIQFASEQELLRHMIKMLTMSDDFEQAKGTRTLPSNP